ncbi:MAG TPA: hypothetical protein VF342_10190 [Alphaproteobacteria bacterium]
MHAHLMLVALFVMLAVLSGLAVRLRLAPESNRGRNASVVAFGTLTVVAFVLLASDCIVTGACMANVVHDVGDDPSACVE